MSSEIFIWHPYEHHRNSVWLILQWKGAAEMVCPLFWSVARKAEHICSLVWTSSQRWRGGRESSKGHWCPDARGAGHTGAGGEGGMEYKAMWLRKKTCCCLPFSPPSFPLINALQQPSIKCPPRLVPTICRVPINELCFLPQIDPQSGMDKNIEHVLLEIESLMSPGPWPFILNLILHKKVNKRAQGWM